jgi:hypothetical protein
MRTWSAVLGGVAILSMAMGAQARVTSIEVSQREAFAGGQEFGEVGAYEKVVGRFHGELDPAEPLNAGIVDLDRAPRNAEGRVEYTSDFFILKPADMAKGNGALFYDVNNRGRKLALGQFNSAPPSGDPTTARDAGNGFLMRNGFTIVWSGWIPGLPDQDHLLRIEVPSVAGARQTVWDEFSFNDRTTQQARLSFPAAPADMEHATLVMRERNTDPPIAVPTQQWEFVDAQTIRLVPAGTAFRIGAIYQLVYQAESSPVAGIGFAATRDFISFLRYRAKDDLGQPNPVAPAGGPLPSRALAHGTSQSGRYVRDFIYRGFNEDEMHRIVFEAVNPHIATGRLFRDFRFAEPNRTLPMGHGNMFFPDASFPWTYESESDPYTGMTDGILARCSARGNCPKIIHTVSDIEYWQSGQSLVTTDPLGRHDVAIPDNVRIYHIADTQHVDFPTMPKGVCALPPNPMDRRPVLRALLMALDRWAKDGTKPPASRYPRLDDNSLVDMAAWRFHVTGVTTPLEPNPRPRLDYGPGYDKGIIGNVLPAILLGGYRVLVPQVDSDGNELGGIRLPDVSVPVATLMG